MREEDGEKKKSDKDIPEGARHETPKKTVDCESRHSKQFHHTTNQV